MADDAFGRVASEVRTQARGASSLRPRVFSVRLAAAAARLHTDIALAVADAALACLAFLAALLLRFGGTVPAHTWSVFARYLPVALGVILAANLGWGLYREMWRHAGVLEARRILLATLTSLSVLAALRLLGLHLLPFSVVLAAIVVYPALAGALRYHSRLFAFHHGPRPATAKRIAIVGAGEAGAALIRDIRERGRGLLPVALLDDDPRKRGRTCHGVAVLGALAELPRVVADQCVDQIVLAIPSASADVVRVVADLAALAGVPLRATPSVAELVHGRISVNDIRELRIDDVLGRQQVSIDLVAVRELLADRRVLITGAGGSIGSEIARQVAGFDPAALLLLDHDETHLYDVCADLHAPVVQLLADIRDGELMHRLVARHRPDIVFHAAAHKHVPLLEDHPSEAVRTNVHGTANVVAAATATDVRTFVFVSTDKAVRPRNVMGASKRVGEQLVLGAAGPGSRYCAVRFGNVLGSRGSVVPTFLRQIAGGGPVTVTDARMTRFFMSIPEAVQLVLQSAALAEGCDVFMLEMGEPVRIVDLAHRMIRLAGRQVGADVEIRIVGSRRGEKLVEDLYTPEEAPTSTVHPSIVRLRPRLVAADQLRAALGELMASIAGDDEDTVRDQLFRTATMRSELTADDADSALLVYPDSVIDLTTPSNGLDAWSPSTI